MRHVNIVRDQTRVRMSNFWLENVMKVVNTWNITIMSLDTLGKCGSVNNPTWFKFKGKSYSIYVSRTSREGLDFRMVTELAKEPSAGDKILILRAGTVETLRKVVLVRFTGVLAKFPYAFIVAEYSK